MPIVSDFTTVIDNTEKLIPQTERDFSFHTGGRDSRGSAFIIFNIRNLRTNLPVKINGRVIGDLTGYQNASDFQRAWFTQIITFQGSILRNGNNELELEGAGGDNFFVKNVQCFFHQGA